MGEKEWVQSTIDLVGRRLKRMDKSLRIWPGKKLAYAYEIRKYESDELTSKPVSYETDFMITEEVDGGGWKPRIVIEAKLGSVTTHDAITYSEKASSHKEVHPYLRYGIHLGERQNYPLPGRLFRHGAYFDFMLSWRGKVPTKSELKTWFDLITTEVEASRKLEEILYDSRKRNRARYTVLHRPLVLK